jgi:ketosteroid isomerase-like protein
MADELQTELLNLEKQYWQAIKDRDVDAALRLTNDPCIVTGAQGVGRIDRPKLAGMIQAASYTIHDFQLQDDAEVTLPSNDVAVLAYKIREELTVDGNPVSLEAADASVWVRRDGRWLCALHTESILGDPFGRDNPRRRTTAKEKT